MFIRPRGKAFTLLELIVVIVVLGILAAIAVPTFSKVITRSKDSAALTTLRSVAREAQALRAFNQTPWTGTEDLDPAIADTSMSALGAGLLAAGSYSPAPATAEPTSSQVTYRTDGEGVLISVLSASGRVCVFGFNQAALGTGVCDAAKTSGSSITAIAAATSGTTSATLLPSGTRTGNGSVTGTPTAPTPPASQTRTFAASATGRTGTVQTWTVPATGTYRITADGAQGGSAWLLNTSTVNPGGKGATLVGDFALTAGQNIQVLVGQAGGDNPSNSRGGGGGGGTYVYNATTSTLLVAAGGGGGAGQYTTPNKDASTTTAAKSGTSGSFGSAGAPGSGGGVGTYSNSGAGWNSNGASSPGDSVGQSWGTGGSSFANGGAGGVGYNDGGPIVNFNGGFGGGGGAYAGGGGGGGYTGGGAGGWSYSGDGGGAGSYSVGTNQSAAVDATGAGGVTILPLG